MSEPPVEGSGALPPGGSGEPGGEDADRSIPDGAGAPGACDATGAEAPGAEATGELPPAEETTPGAGGSSVEEAVAANGASELPPGGRPRRRERRRARLAARSRRRRRMTRLGIAFVLLVLAVAGSAIGYVVYQVNSIARVQVQGLTKPTSTGPLAHTENILLVGSTSRCAVKPAKSFENFVQECEEGVNGVNSDVVMILRLSPGRPAELLSIPRDTFVPNARTGDNANKIDAALADGPSQLVAAVQDDFGIPINHYVVLNFQTFANIVQALGGISMYFPTTLFDNYSGLRINDTGCVHISGLMALALVRARHLQYGYDKATGQWTGYDPTGDLGRIERVHIFLKVLASEVARRGLANPVTDSSLLSALAPDLTVDTTLGYREMLDLLLQYHSSLAAAQELTLPIVEDSNDYYQYEGYNYGAVVFPVEPEDSSTIAQFMGKVGALPAPRSVSVSVLDGTGSPSVTAAASSALAADGFTVTGSSATTPVGPISEATVVYSSPGTLPAAERVLSALHGTAVLERGRTTGGAEVTLVTGSNAVVGHLAAVPAAPSAGRASTTQSTAAPQAKAALAVASGAQLAAAELPAADGHTAAEAASPSVPNAGGVITAPTSASEAIPPYDPRACPAS